MYCLCRLCCSMYCLCANVYCTTASVCQPNSSYQNISYHIISYHIISYHIVLSFCDPKFCREKNKKRCSSRMLHTLDWLVVTKVSGQHTGPIYSVQCCPLKMGPTGCSKNSVTTTLRCVTSQKSRDLTHTATEALN